MADILSFPDAQSGFPGGEHRIANELFLFGSSDRGRIFTSLHDELHSEIGDWSNQELADLYRVEAILTQANIRISTARGITDEGDPWFIFCREDGEVFVHLARIDGQYLLDSPNVGQAITGRDFKQLVERFVENLSARAPVGNVVQLRPGAGAGDVVLLHPLMMLAALVWTIYAAGEEFIGTAHAGEMQMAGDDAGGVVWQGSVPGLDGTLAPLPATLPGSATDGAKPIRTDGIVHAGDRLANGTDGARGWSGVEARAAYHSFLSLLVQSAVIGMPLMALNHDSGPDTDTPVVELFASGHDMPESFAIEATAVTEGAEAIVPESIVARDGGANGAGEPIEPGHALGTVVADAVPERDHGGIDATARLEVSPAVMADQELPRLMARSVAGSQDTAGHGGDIAIKSGDILGLAAAFGKIENYKLHGVDLSTTIEVASLASVLDKVAEQVRPDMSDDLSDLFDMLPRPSHGDGPLDMLDRAGQSFIRYFLQKVDDVELIQVGSHVILVDLTSIDDADDDAFSVTWTLEGEGRVSTVGHLEDFVDFGLA